MGSSSVQFQVTGCVLLGFGAFLCKINMELLKCKLTKRRIFTGWCFFLCAIIFIERPQHCLSHHPCLRTTGVWGTSWLLWGNERMTLGRAAWRVYLIKDEAWRLLLCHYTESEEKNLNLLRGKCQTWLSWGRFCLTKEEKICLLWKNIYASYNFT